MTVVTIGRKDGKDFPLQFAFENSMDAFVMYSQAKDTYREDDLVIEMTEEGDE